MDGVKDIVVMVAYQMAVVLGRVLRRTDFGAGRSVGRSVGRAGGQSVVDATSNLKRKRIGIVVEEKNRRVKYVIENGADRDAS